VLIDAATQRISSARVQSELGVRFRPITETLSDEAHWFRPRGLIGPHPSGDTGKPQSRNAVAKPQ